MHTLKTYQRIVAIYAGKFCKKNKLNKSNNDHVRPIIQAFLSFCSLFPYASRIASKKICRPNIFLYDISEIPGLLEKSNHFNNIIQHHG